MGDFDVKPSEALREAMKQYEIDTGQKVMAAGSARHAVRLMYQNSGSKLCARQLLENMRVQTVGKIGETLVWLGALDKTLADIEGGGQTELDNLPDDEPTNAETEDEA